MPDRAVRLETVRAARALRVGSVTLLAIERVVVRGGRGTLGAAWLLAAVEPYALVASGPDGVRVVATWAPGISIEELRERIPGLDAALAAA